MEQKRFHKILLQLEFCVHYEFQYLLQLKENHLAKRQNNYWDFLHIPPTNYEGQVYKDFPDHIVLLYMAGQRYNNQHNPVPAAKYDLEFVHIKYQ